MTRLDTAALHRWLTVQSQLARIDRDRRDYDTNHSIDAGDRLAALTKVDGWLRRQAGDQLHTPGLDRDPPAFLASGRVVATVEDLRGLLEEWAETPIEARAKTFQEVANQLDRFTLAPDPFPHGDDTPGWAPPVPRSWSHRLQLAYRAARDLIR